MAFAYMDKETGDTKYYTPPQKPSNKPNNSYANSDIKKPQTPSVVNNPYYDKWLALEEDRKAGIEAEQRAAERRLREQIAQGVSTLEAQLPELQKQYEVGAQEAYRMLMQSQKNMPEMLAAQGYHGGASETATAMLETENGNRLNSLQDRYNSGVNGINGDIANLRSSGNIAIAENASKYAQELRNTSLAGQQELAALMKQLQSAGSGNSPTDNNLTLDQIIRAKNAGLSGTAIDDALGNMGLQYNQSNNAPHKTVQSDVSQPPQIDLNPYVQSLIITLNQYRGNQGRLAKIQEEYQNGKIDRTTAESLIAKYNY